MQTVIYADVLVALNTVLTYLLIAAASAVSRVPNRAVGTVLASLGGGFSALILFADLSVFWAVLYKLGTAALIVLLAFLPKRPKPFWKAYLAFFGAGCLFGGAVLAAELVFHPARMLVRNGTVYFDVSVVTLLAVSLAVYGLLLVAEKVLRARTARGDLCPATLWLRDRSVALTALADSGNSLTDPLTGRAVSVASVNALAPLFSGEELAFLRAPTVGEEVPQSLGRRFRLVPCRSVGGRTLLKAVVFDRLDVTDGKRRLSVPGAVVAASPEPLGVCQLLLNFETGEESAR